MLCVATAFQAAASPLPFPLHTSVSPPPSCSGDDEFGRKMAQVASQDGVNVRAGGGGWGEYQGRLNSVCIRPCVGRAPYLPP